MDIWLLHRKEVNMRDQKAGLESTQRKRKPRRRDLLSMTWETFLGNHKFIISNLTLAYGLS